MNEPLLNLAFVKKSDIAKVFTEWERRFREEPEQFQSDYERLNESAETYGDGAASYFLKIFNEINEIV